MLILQKLRQENLEWIRVADPLAGRVDDLQIGSPGRVDAYQVKTSQYGGLFTFRDLTVAHGSKPGLMAQLGQGWLELKDAYPLSNVVVHLVTNQSASNSSQAQIPIGDPPPTPKHFAAFIEQVWKPAHQNPRDTAYKVPEEWFTTWNALRDESGLSEEVFNVFVRACALDFGFDTQPMSRTTSIRDHQIAEEDIEKITYELFQTVADPERIVYLSREELLHRLNWLDRFEYKSLHRFPISDQLYQEIEPTATKLAEAIDSLPGGYIAVLGAPGSGKSTLLTKIHRNLDVRWIPYYTYVPDDPGPRSRRGESVNFLHDMVLGMDQSGFQVGKSPNRPDRNQLLERFHQQLKLLHQDWKKTARKTVILIDGLDHIEREQKPVQSLLDDLPTPDQVPEGVYLVLGTQTDSIIPSRIQTAVRKPGRKIKMAPLKRLQVHDVVHAAKLPVVIKPEQFDLVYGLSNGHPLYLNYLVKRMGSCSNPKQLDEVLQVTEPYDDDIETTYHSYWQRFHEDADLRRLLGLLARIRGVIDLSWVRTWAGRTVIQRIGDHFAHYFRIENANHWYFFHNSFRLFLIAKTSEFPAGCHDPLIDREFYAELADRYATNAVEEHSMQIWEELHHRVAAMQHPRVLELATQEYFRKQFLSFRPLETIRTDILGALRSAVCCQDPIAFIRLCLAGSEMTQRRYYLEDIALVPLLLRLGLKHLALEQLRTGTKLRTNRSTALQAVKLLKRQGLEEEAHRIFEIAEPLDLLSGTMLTPSDWPDDTSSLLQDWARAAVWCRELDQVIDTIHHIPYKDQETEKTFDNQPTKSLQVRLLFEIGLELLEQKHWTDLTKLLNTFELTCLDHSLAQFWLHFHVYRDRHLAGDNSRALEQLHAMSSVARNFLRPKELIVLAESVYRSQGDIETARNLIAELHLPEPPTISIGDEGAEFDYQLLRTIRLMYVLGEYREPTEIFPDPEDPRDKGMTLYRRAICTVAHIWAQGWVGHLLELAEIQPLVKSLCSPFYNSRADFNRWAFGPEIPRAMEWFFGLLIEAVAVHGKEALDRLRDVFEQEWHGPDTRHYWPIAVRRSLIQCFARQGIPREWAKKALQELDASVPDYGDVSSRVEEYVKQAEAWLDMEDKERAQHFLELALQVGFGVGYRKDYQMEQWIGWLDKINHLEPEKSLERIARYAHAIEGLEESTEGWAVAYAAEELLVVTFHHSPMRTMQLLSWFEDRGLINHWTGIGALLKEGLKISEPPIQVTLQVVQEFLVPFDTTGDPDLMRKLVGHIIDSWDGDQAIDTIRSLVDKVRLNARPSVRSEWFSGIVDGAEGFGISGPNVGVGIDDLEGDEDQVPSVSKLMLRDEARPLSIREVQARVNSVADIHQLLKKETEGSYFNWTPVVSLLSQRINDAQELDKLAQLFRQRRNANSILADISIRLNHLGYKQAAWNMGREALKLSRGIGWSAWFAEESRIFAFKALDCIDKDHMLPLVYETLIQDLEENFDLVAPLGAALDDIWALLCSPTSVPDIWTEIEEHTHALLGAALSSSPPNVFQGEVSRDTAQRTLLELITVHLDHPCQALPQAAQRSLGNLLLDDVSDVSDVLMDVLERSEGYQESVLMLLHAVSLAKPDVLAAFRNHIYRLANSPNWRIRMMTHAIFCQLGWIAPEVSKRLEQAPSVYSPWPIRDTPIFEPGESTGRPISDPDDPFQIVKIFSPEIEQLSELALVAVENLHQRVVEFMHTLVSEPSEWSSQVEKELQSLLAASGRRMTYIRPRFRIAQRALFHVIAEMLDFNIISHQAVGILDSWLRTYDPQMVLAEPTYRPAQIARMSTIPMTFDPGEWSHDAETALPLTEWTPTDQRTVLAEATSLKWEDNLYSPTETRYSVLETDRSPPGVWRHNRKPCLQLQRTL